MVLCFINVSPLLLSRCELFLFHFFIMFSNFRDRKLVSAHENDQVYECTVCLYLHKSVLFLLDSKASSVQLSSVPAAQVPYTLSLCAHVSCTRPVSKVVSNCSLDPLQYLNAEKTQTTVGILLRHLLRVGLI